jgi:hypothetical protein
MQAVQCSMTSISNILKLISRCRYQDIDDVDRQIELLNQINSAVPKRVRRNLLSLITNDYVSKALDILEERIIRMPMAG